MYEFFYKQDYGKDVVAVISEGEPGEYDENPSVKEYTDKGYKLVDANMFGEEGEIGEILIFVPDKE